MATIQQLELSLLPKPFSLHVQLNNDIAKIYDLLVEIRTIRQGIPRQETVLDVLPLRQNLVSSVYIVLFAVAHAARSRTPLPQFMTSPVEAVNNWAKAVEEHLNSGSRSRSRSPTRRGEPEGLPGSRTTSPELAVLYACAEREALSQLSHCMEDVSHFYLRELLNNTDPIHIAIALEDGTNVVRSAVFPLSTTAPACR